MAMHLTPAIKDESSPRRDVPLKQGFGASAVSSPVGQGVGDLKDAPYRPPLQRAPEGPADHPGCSCPAPHLFQMKHRRVFLTGRDCPRKAPAPRSLTGAVKAKCELQGPPMHDDVLRSVERCSALVMVYFISRCTLRTIYSYINTS